MGTLVLIMAGLLVLGLVYVKMPVITQVYFRFRGKKRITCPETDKPAEVEVDARRAAASAAYGRPKIELTSCSEWPEHRDCDQNCAKQI